MDAWLREGGLIVAANERAARSLAAQFHRGRRAEGLAAWPSPKIYDWHSFVRIAWNEQPYDGRVVLSSLQEQALWTRIVADTAPEAVRLGGAAERLAALAMDAHHLLCGYAPQFLDDKARLGWDGDAGAFSGWLRAFNAICQNEQFLSAARLPLELAERLKADAAPRSPLLLTGFDRILFAQQRFFAAWGEGGCVREARPGAAAERIEFYAAADPSSELAACALWAKDHRTAHPDAHLLVIAQDARNRRGEIERAFLRDAFASGDFSSASNLLEFSLGVPLGQVALARGAQLLLRWLNEAIAENELDWLLATGQFAAAPEESRTLFDFVRALRRRGLARTHWTLAEFLRQRPGVSLPEAWVARMAQARQQLQESAKRQQTPLAWAEFATKLLEVAGWPGARPLASAEFQVLRRWRQSLEECASLGFDGRRSTWSEFFAALDRVVNETLFAPESMDAPILVAGPAESAGLTADAIWFLGASEEAWPATGAAQPFLPLAIARQAGMPHASPVLDWDLARVVTRRLLASAPEVCFSYARQNEEVEARPSRLVAQLAGVPRELPAKWIAAQPAAPLTVEFDDGARIPYPHREVAGGAFVLTAQSRCAFQAFARARLDADGWDAAEAGLNAAERGRLLHEVLHAIWAGAPDGIRTHAELAALKNLNGFVEERVRRVLAEKMPARAREAMPRRYLELEAKRLAGLVTEWLRYEAARTPFVVEETEFDARSSISGLALKVRLDRVDRLNDNSLLVIDYKTGQVSPNAWNLPRPDDVQLPLYAVFALGGIGGDAGGLVFARIRAGENKEFLGRVRNAKATVLNSLGAQKALVKNPLADDDLAAWRASIEDLAQAFLAGRAEADPRDWPSTCERCGLVSLCRIAEHPPQTAADAGGDAEETADA